MVESASKKTKAADKAKVSPSEYYSDSASDESYGDVVSVGEGDNWYIGSRPKSDDERRQELREAYLVAMQEMQMASVNHPPSPPQ